MSEYGFAISLKSEISHHGIDGQKWGVRNGPPYPLERKSRREINAEKKNNRLVGNENRLNLSTRDKAKILKSNMDDLTNEEIEWFIKRLELEKKVGDFYGDKAPEKKDPWLLRAAKNAGESVLSTVVPAVTVYAFKALVANTMGEDVVKEMFPKKK